MERILPPGPSSARLLQTLRYARDPMGFIGECRQKYGDVFSMRVLGENWVFLTQPEHIKQLFTIPHVDVAAGDHARSYFGLITGDTSVMVLDGDAHLQRRRLLLPTMQGERMQAYCVAMRDLTQAAMASWPRGMAFSLQPRLQQLSLDIIMRVVFGVGDAGTPHELAPLITRVAREVLGSPFLFLRKLRVDWGRFSPWGRIVRLMQATDRALLNEIAKRRESNASDASILSLLLATRREDGSALSDREVRDGLMTFLFAGHETTAASLTWVVERVLSSPDVLAHARRELLEVAGVEALTHEHMSRLPFLDAVIKETLRVRSIMPTTGSRRLTKPLHIGEHIIPTGTVVGAAACEVHRRAEIYSSPDEFKPERFVGKTSDPFNWLAFGGGSRRCLGLHFAMYEMKVVLATLLQRDSLELVHPNVAPKMRGIFMHPKGGAPVKLP